MKKLIDRLKNEVEGEVRDDLITRRAYSVDASIYEVEPLCVVTPKSKEDIVKVVKAAAEYGVPLIARGAATGITGGCLGSGIVIDVSKYLNKVLSIDWERKQVTCQPGIVQDHLNAMLAEKGFRLGPDTSTGNRATIGGMVGNNSAGSRSLKYGRMVDAVLELEVILGNGEVVRLKEIDQKGFQAQCDAPGFEGEIYRTVRKIREEYRHDIEEHFPKIPRRVSGYNLDELLNGDNLNLCKVFVGSEGSLGIATEVMLKIDPIPKCTGLLLIHVQEMIEGLKAIEDLLRYQPISIEMIDHHIIEPAKASPALKNHMTWLDGSPEAIFIMEIEEDSTEKVKEKLQEIADELLLKNIGYSHRLLVNRQEMEEVWAVRKGGLGLLLSKRCEDKAISFIEDMSVAPSKLAFFIAELKEYLKSKGKDAGIYGHIGSGCMHIRPYMNSRKLDDVTLMEKIMRDVTKMVLKYNGSLSGEHGDGLIRSWLNKSLFGERVYRAFVELKYAFDPDNRMNPGKVVHAEPFYKNFKMDPDLPVREIHTFMDFSKEGGFGFAADMCNGNGQCRKLEGTMCPSFQASHDEYHTTRARAQALRAIFTGRKPTVEWPGDELKDVLDLCIECKGCKKECPSMVDMAKMKAEFLYHRHRKYGSSFRDRLFAFLGDINKVISPFARIVNVINRSFLSKKIFHMLGISSEHPLPGLALKRFSCLYKEYASAAEGRKVVLFNDTFTEYHSPEIGLAAVKVLEALGYRVIVPNRQCCGRTMISKGFLSHAKKRAEALIETLLPYAEGKIPIVILEPSCHSAIIDDFQGLLGYNHTGLQIVIPHCRHFDAFIAEHIVDNRLPLNCRVTEQHIKIHRHCHQKALSGTSEALRVLGCIPGISCVEIPTGCCGMAGSFGYEREHVEFSKKIAELKLVPEIKNMSQDSVVIANGFSCRCQISYLTDAKPLHFAEFLAKSLIYQNECLEPEAGHRKS